jgi:hypothetical protein
MQRLKDKHKGEIIYVIGSGPSIESLSDNFFSDKISIGVNLVCLRFKVDYAVARHRKTVIELSNLGIPLIYSEYSCDGRGLNLNPKIRGAYMFHHLVGSSPRNIEFHKMSSEMIINSSSTITSAFHAAAFMGAKKIIICGHDLKMVNGKLNYSGYQRKPLTDKEVRRYLNVLEKSAFQTPQVLRYLEARYNCEFEFLKP